MASKETFERLGIKTKAQAREFGRNIGERATRRAISQSRVSEKIINFINVNSLTEEQAHYLGFILGKEIGREIGKEICGDILMAI